MTKKITISLSLSLIILFTGIFLKNYYEKAYENNMASKRSGSENNLQLDKIKYDNLSDESEGNVATYETVKPVDPEKDIEYLLKTFGFSDKYTRKDDPNNTIVFFNEEEKFLMYYKNTGGFEYNNPSRSNSNKKIIISDDFTNKCYEKAQEILMDLDIKNVVRGSAPPITPEELKYDNIKKNQTSTTLFDLPFYRTLDEKTVKGFEGVEFAFDSYGEIASAQVSAKEYKKSGQVPVISPRKAFDKFKINKNGYVGTADYEATEAEITDSELIYWVEIESPASLYITKPSYSVKGKTLSSSNKVDKKIDNTIFIRMDAID